VVVVHVALPLYIRFATNISVSRTKMGGGEKKRKNSERIYQKYILPQQGTRQNIGSKLLQMERLEIGTRKSDIGLGKGGLGYGTIWEFNSELYVTGQTAGLASTAAGSGNPGHTMIVTASM
jgi:hypothetical protein